MQSYKTNQLSINHSFTPDQSCQTSYITVSIENQSTNIAMHQTTNTKLFDSIAVGNNQLSARLAMAPMTRCRASDDHTQLPFVKTYYAQRAAVPGTMIITEATLISLQSGSQANVPGIWNDEQVKAWRYTKLGVTFGCSYGLLAELQTRRRGGKKVLGSSFPVRRRRCLMGPQSHAS
jgi:hypothetical protein